MDKFFERENENLDKLNNSYSEELRDRLTYDGLMIASIIHENPEYKDLSEEEAINKAVKLYLENSRRLAIIYKEPNNEAGEDYRDFNLHESSPRMAFFKVMAGWVEGLHLTTKDFLPQYTDEQLRAKVKEVFCHYPFVFCNIKKLSGGGSSDWEEIWEYGKRDAEYLKKQIREIEKPNIILCCGSTENEKDVKGKMINLVKEVIFPDVTDFYKVNDFCHYSPSLGTVLIDTYHPSYPDRGGWSTEEMVNLLLRAFQDFLKKTDFGK